jgi:hypothetical protein
MTCRSILAKAALSQMTKVLPLRPLDSLEDRGHLALQSCEVKIDHAAPRDGAPHRPANPGAGAACEPPRAFAA